MPTENIVDAHDCFGSSQSPPGKQRCLTSSARETSSFSSETNCVFEFPGQFLNNRNLASFPGLERSGVSEDEVPCHN